MIQVLNKSLRSRPTSTRRDAIRRRVTIALLTKSLLVFSLAAPSIAQPLDPDATGIVWVGTSTGIFKVEGSRLVLDPDQPGVVSYGGGDVILHVTQPASPTQLAVDPEGEILWAHTNNTLHALDFEGQPLFTVPLALSGAATDLAVNPADGSVWLAIGSSVLHFDGSGVALGSFSVPSPIVGLRPDSFNRVWVARSSAVTAYDAGTGAPIADLDLGKGKTTVADIDVGLWSWMLGQSQSDGLYVVANKGWRSYTVSSGGATADRDWIVVPSGQRGLAWSNMTNGAQITDIPINTPTTIPNPLQSPALHIVAEWGHAWIGGGWELARPFDLLADPLLVDLGSGVEITALAANQPERTPPVLQQVIPAQGAWTRFNPPVFELSYDDPPGASDSRVSGVDPTKAVIMRSNVWLAASCVEAPAGSACVLEDVVPEGQNSFFISMFDYAANQSSFVSRSVSVDSLPPSITITSPADGASLADRLPPIEVSYDDASSGVDTGSLAFFANGGPLDVSCFTQSTMTASCQPVAPLPGGAVVIEAKISDVAGSQAAASVSITIDAEDTSAPILNIVTPEEGLETTSPTPSIEISYVDQGDGIDGNSLVLLVNGVVLDATCSQSGSLFSGVLSCVPVSALGLGPKTIEPTVTDLAGNTSSPAVRHFTIVPAFTDVTGQLVKPDGAAAAGANVTVVGKGTGVTDSQGFFTFTAIPVSTGERLTVTASLVEAASAYSTRIDSLIPVYGGVTDVGVLSLGELCTPRFSAAFDPPTDSMPGRVYSLATFDDASGAGDRLYAGGSSSFGVARWTGGGWEVPWAFSGTVRDLAVFDDGSGLALYAAGSFTSIDGLAISRVARWRGAAWEAVGSGFNATVFDLAVLDLGEGPRLYAAGDFSLSDGARVASWNGTSWTSVGGPLDDEVEALEGYDDGTGIALYAGGQFVYSGALRLDHVARLQGGAWAPVGGGVDKTVKDLVTFDAGNGEVLVAAGTFRVVQGEVVGLVATWDGTTWDPMGDLVGPFGCGSCAVNDLAVVRAGSETQLFAAGVGFSQVSSRVIAVWNGSAWAALPGEFLEGTFGGVETLFTVDASPTGGGSSLFVGGSFEVLGGVRSWNVGELHRSCDATPPVIVVTSPTNPAATTQSSITLAGSVEGGDVFYAGGQRLSLNGDGSFVAPPLSLADGHNAIALRALDDVGNQSEMVVQVLRDGVPPSIEFVEPVAGETVDRRKPEIEVAYRDDQLLDLASLTLRLNGSPVGMDCQRGGLGALCRPTEDLPAGSLTLTATVADLAGNVSPQAQRSFTVSSTSGPSSTTLVGSVRLPSGAPAAGAEVTVLGQRGRSAIAASDGSFLLSGAAATNGPVTVVARYQDASGGLAGFVADVTPVAGGTTDVGVIELKALCDLELDEGFSNGVGVDGQYPEKNPDGSDTNLSARVFALDVFDDGAGPALYVGGRFESAGGVPATGIARWDGQRWSHLDGGVKSGNVYALEVFDDGTGPALYVAGSFFRVGGGHDLLAGLSARGIARWNGTTWSVVGGSTNGTVRALASVTIGGGTSLYAGGRFTSVAGVAANHVARWDGQAWAALGSGLGGSSEGVYALASFKAPKGQGQALYAGGDFEHTAMRRLAVWDGSKWAAAGGGVEANTVSDFKGVWALTVFEDRLVAGGSFSKVGGNDLEAVCVAAWDGRAWSALPGLGCTSFQTFDTPTGGAQALAVYDDGTGAHLYALGALNLLSSNERSSIFRWNGSHWSSVAGGLAHGYDWNGMALATFDSDPSDSLRGSLFAGSGFLLAGPEGAVNANGLASWDGSQWSALQNGVPEPVTGLTVLDSGSGPDLYVAGYTTDKRFPSSWQPFKPLRWDGGGWLSLPRIETSEAWEQSGHDYAKVEDLAALDDGSGMAVFAVGEFQKVGPWTTPGVAKWDGRTWVPFSDEGLPPLGGTLDPVIDWNSVDVFDGGQGPRIVVAGAMNDWSGVVEWTGREWRRLGAFGSASGGDIQGFKFTDLAVFDGSGAPELFVAGEFESVDGSPIAYLARWDGTSWSAAGDFDGAVNGLAVFDDGSGVALYATGYFQNVDGRSAKYVARWNGAEWQPVGSGLAGWGIELGVADDGAGERLFVGGRVEVIDGQLGSGFAFWDGASWQTIPTGIGVSANRIVGFDDGTGPAVFIGGGAWYPSMNYLKKFQRPLSCATGPDTTPPTLAFTEPATGASVFTARPGLGFSYADSGGGVDTSTLAVKANGVALPVTCSYLVAAATCTPGADLPSGAVTLTATIKDFAGNTSLTAQVGVTVVTGPPAVAITAPANGSIAQVDQLAVELSYTENADPSTLDLQSAPQTVAFSCSATSTTASCVPLSPLAEGQNTLTATVSGFDGSPATPAQVTFTIDLSPPSVAFTAPANGSFVPARPELRLAYGDVGAGVDPSTLRIHEGGIDLATTCTTGPSEATCTPIDPLAEGSHTLTATIADLAGRLSAATQVTFEVTTDVAGPVITLTSPAPDSATTASEIRLVGSLDEAASLTVNGGPVALDAGNGFDHGPLALSEGWNRFVLVATDAVGNVSSLTFRVLRDTTPPVLSFIAPTEGAYFDPSVQPFEVRWGDSGTAVDPASLQLTADGAPLAVTCTACGSGAVCTPTTPPAGTVVLAATVADGVGRTASAQVRFTTDPNGDLVAPQIFLSVPTSGTTTSESEQRFVGDLSEPAALTIAGVAALVDSDLHFDHAPVVLTEGTNTVELRATDAAGNVGTRVVTLTLDSTAPPPVDVALVTVDDLGSGRVAVTGAAGCVTPVDSGDVVRVENRYSSSLSEVDLAADGSFSAVLAAVGGDELSLATRDAAGNWSVSRSVSVPGMPTLPPDPSSVAPSLDRSVATDFCTASAFLYSGASPVQTGTLPGAIDCERVAVLRGRVLDRDGLPISGVRVSVLHQPEAGGTLTRSDGRFDLAANGGDAIVVRFAKPGLLPVDRRVSAGWRERATIADVVMLSPDGAATVIDLAATPPIQVARGSAVTDGDGTRRATLFFAQGTAADAVHAGGASEPLGSFTVRATEYTVGPSGLAAMPADLPDGTSYTYAVELSIDEAGGAESVRFSKPVAVYLENFVGLPVGTDVPSGYYDRAAALWRGSRDGRIVQILSTVDGRAELDVDGSGVAADAATLQGLGVTDDERAQLGSLYAVGQSLWRVEVDHFTAWDFNYWAWFADQQAALAAEQARQERLAQIRRNIERTKRMVIDCDSLASGSIIECTNQVLGEAIGVAGAGTALHYRSDRVPGRLDARTLEVPVSGATVPAGTKRIELRIEAGGQRVSQTFPPDPNLTYVFTWDGNDEHGRSLQGRIQAKVRLGYVYDGTYQDPPEDGEASFGGGGSGPLAPDPAREEVTLWAEASFPLGVWDAREQGLGGWTLTQHHTYDPSAQILYRGDGGRRTVAGVRVTTTVAGLGVPDDVAVAPDGTVYYSDYGTGPKVRVVHPDGTTAVVLGAAGSGGAPPAHGAVAASVLMPGLIDIAVDPATGRLHLLDAGEKTGAISLENCGPTLYYCPHWHDTSVWRVEEDGVLTHLYGDPHDTGAPLYKTLEGIEEPEAFAIDRLGDLAVADSSHLWEDHIHREIIIYRVGPNGIPVLMAAGNVQTDVVNGGGVFWAEHEDPVGGAFDNVNGLAFDSLGDLYFTVGGSCSSVWRRHTGGLVELLAGAYNPEAFDAGETICSGFAGDGGAGTEAFLRFPTGIAVAETADGLVDVYFSDTGNDRVRRINVNTGAIDTVWGTGATEDNGDDKAGRRTNLWFPDGLASSPDGDLVVADTNHRKVRRLQKALPQVSTTGWKVPSEDGSAVYVFDAVGRHLETRAADTGIALLTFGYQEIDGRWLLSSMTDPFGNVVQVERAVDGRPSVIIGAFGDRTDLTVGADGYLATVTNPAAESVGLEYTPGGLLHRLVDPKSQPTTFQYDALGRLVRDSNPAGGFQELIRSADALPGTGVLVDLQVERRTALGRSAVYRREELASGGRAWTVTDSAGITKTSRSSPLGEVVGALPGGITVSAVTSEDPRQGALTQVVDGLTLATPGGRTTEVSITRSVTLADPALGAADLQNVLAESLTVSVGGRQATYSYDHVTRVQTATSPEGRQTTTTLDSLGRTIEEQALGTEPVTRAYDGRGRLDSVTQGTRLTDLVYGTDGRLSKVVDPALRETAYTYDTAGRVRTITLPDGRQVGVSYDANGNVVSITPPGRPAHVFSRTPIDVVASYTPPDIGSADPVTTIEYNLDGQVELVDRPGNETIDLIYEASTGRLASILTDRGTHTYTYASGSGLPESITDPAGGTVSFGYDGLFQTSESWSGEVTGTVAYALDDELRVSSLTVGSEPAITFSYDLDGLLTGAGPLSVDRDAATGRVTGTSLGVVTESSSYDGTYGEVSSHAWQLGSTDLFSASYVRDELGRIARREEAVLGAVEVEEYSYDAAGRLVDVTRDGAPVAHYDYDQSSNRVSWTDDWGTATATYDAQDRLLDAAGITYAYTEAGELLSKTNGTQTVTYDYDAFGNLISVVLADGLRIDYVVDGVNRRIGKKVDGVLAWGLLYADRLQPVAKVDPLGNVLQTFVYATSGTVPDYIVTSDGTTYRVVSDHLGSVRLVVDVADGSVVHRLDYDAFGRVTFDSNPGFQPFGFAGGLYDHQTKLVRFGARDYDPEVGRWTSKDPIGFAGGDTNLYGYVLADPVNLTDPSGTLVPLIIGAAALTWSVLDAGFTFLDPCATAGQKVASAALLAVDAVGGAAARLGRGAAVGASRLYTKLPGQISHADELRLLGEAFEAGGKRALVIGEGMERVRAARAALGSSARTIDDFGAVRGRAWSESLQKAFNRQDFDVVIRMGGDGRAVPSEWYIGEVESLTNGSIVDLSGLGIHLIP